MLFRSCLALFAGLPAVSWAGDWRLYAISEDNALYLDAATVHATRNGMVHVWIEKVDGAKTHQNNLSDAAERRATAMAEAGYVPPVAYLMGISDASKGDNSKSISSLMIVEAAADVCDSVVIQKWLIEVDCDQQRSQPLTTTHPDGTQFDFKGTNGEFVVPGTPADTLLKFICDQPKFIKPKTR